MSKNHSKCACALVMWHHAHHFRGLRRNRKSARHKKYQYVNKHSLPNPVLVKTEILKSFNAGKSHFNPIDINGIVDNDPNVIVLAEQNKEFYNKKKWEHFKIVDAEVLKRVHLFAIEETDFDGLSSMAQANNYFFFCGKANDRGQAVGFAVHPRLKVLQKIEYNQITEIKDVPQLRSAVRLDIEDSKIVINGQPLQFTVVVVHLKSMRGNAIKTALTRREQLKLLLTAMNITNEFTIIMGDFNCFLNNTSDTDLLIQDGYELVNPHNRTSTQSQGGRLDGCFYKNLPAYAKIGWYRVFQFFKNPLIGRSWTDHALLSWHLRIHTKISASFKNDCCLI